MTIRKGESWGVPGGISPGSPVVGTDDGARRHLQQMWSSRDERSGPPEVGIVGGDLHSTLGAPRHDEADLAAGRATRFPMDVGTVRVDDGPEQVFVAHLIATESPSRTSLTAFRAVAPTSTPQLALLAMPMYLVCTGQSRPCWVCPIEFARRAGPDLKPSYRPSRLLTSGPAGLYVWR